MRTLPLRKPAKQARQMTMRALSFSQSPDSGSKGKTNEDDEETAVGRAAGGGCIFAGKLQSSVYRAEG